MREHFPRWHPWLLCAFRTVLRAGELIALQWGDIDWHGRFVMVQTADTGQTYTVQISTAKRNTWQTVGFALREAPVEIDRQALGLSQEVLVRITSIDGFTSVSTERRFKAMVL